MMKKRWQESLLQLAFKWTKQEEQEEEGFGYLSNFVGYLMPKLSLQKNSNSNI